MSLLIVTSALLAGVFGCPGLMPGPESVLEGTWELIPRDGFDEPLRNCLLTFDSRGEITAVSYEFEDQTTVTWRDPPASVSVDGDQVHLSATKSGNGLNFYGTLNSTTEPTGADGTLSERGHREFQHVRVAGNGDTRQAVGTPTGSGAGTFVGLRPGVRGSPVSSGDLCCRWNEEVPLRFSVRVRGT